MWNKEASFRTWVTCGLYAALVVLSIAGCSDETDFDILIEDGLVYDGTGAPPMLADVAIKGDRIVDIAVDITGSSEKIIDAGRRVVAPGFIDVHAHLEPLPLYPAAESFLRQGVTTALGGPDGSSPLPLRDYLDSLQALEPGINVGYLIGHGSIRSEVMHLDNRIPTDDELNLMKSIVRESMEAGAFGISTGLKYVPGTFAQTEEISELAMVSADMGGIYTSHLRDEGMKLIEGVAEAISIARDADITVLLTHHKVVGKPMWGASEATLAMVDSARQTGLDIRLDQYPYTASYTTIAVLIPPWALEGSRMKAFRRRIADPVLRDSIKAGIEYNLRYDRGGDDLSRIQIVKFDYKPELIGKTLYDWAVSEGLEPTIPNGAELVIEAQANGGASCIYHVLDEGDVVRIMRHPQTMHASDGLLSLIGAGHPHPRAFGTFPRILGRYVREQNILTMAEAIRKMTSLPADLLDLDDRGTLREGAIADITIFNAETINDKGTFEDPNQFPEGIEHVIVNGQMAFSDDSLSAARSGVVLRGSGFSVESNKGKN